MASNNVNDQIIARIQSNPKYSNCLISEAIKDSDIAFIDLLLRNGANVNAFVENDGNYSHCTLLYYAISHHGIEMTNMLLLHNPDIYKSSSIHFNDVFPIELAFSHLNIAIFKLLVNHHMDHYTIDAMLPALGNKTLLLLLTVDYKRYERHGYHSNHDQLIEMITYVLDCGANYLLKMWTGAYNGTSPILWARGNHLQNLVDLFQSYNISPVPTKGVHLDSHD